MKVSWKKLNINKSSMPNTRKLVRSTAVFSMLTLSAMLLFQNCETDKRSGKDQTDMSKIVVLTFDDAVKSHRTFVAPMLKDYGFNATFFITYEWMEDTINFMTWDEVGELHQMGFEIGNHCWHHWDFSQPKTAAMLEGELGLVNWELMRKGIPKPISYAYNGNGFGPEAVRVLDDLGYQFARRGMQPEIPYGELKAGPGFDPEKHHQLLIPTTSDAYPEMDLDHFVKVLNSVKENEIPILQFHGVPDIAHPWVNTPQENFRKYMDYLKANDYQVIAMQELDQYLPQKAPNDPLLTQRHTHRGDNSLEWPDEVISTRNKLNYWLANMYHDHNYSQEEMMEVTGLEASDLDQHLALLNQVKPETEQNQLIKVRPYPGVRHPRINFKDGMLSPMRGTKASIFLPWAPEEYVVLDLPEALFTQFGLTFLGHKHIPTLFDYQKTVIPNSDWRLSEDGSLSNSWKLPINVTIGAEVHPQEKTVDMKLWIQNNSDTTFTDLQSQVCIMFKEAKQFKTLSNENKLFDSPVTAVKSSNSNHWIITAWNGCNHAWGNADCPCMHSDPKLHDCKPGETVSVSGKIWFYEGDNIENEISLIKSKFTAYQ
jgi:peptidoglycan/xylan/chitin deacetylase (PgdA/CDA1 family)